MAAITGALRDFGLNNLTPLSPRLVFTASAPAVTRSGIFSTRPVVAIPNGSGNFTVELQETASIRPAIFYRIRIEWMEDGEGTAGYVGVDLLHWPLFVPPEGGAIGDLIQAPANSSAVWVGLLPPTDPTPGTWWLEMNPDDAADPRNTGQLYEWSDN
ncbi:hypothetical protein [Curtobacterium sp. MCBD17_021]|uniref:hypothetical protein n=1 Tax=Curtobacterium sp. MCBD17_021 TaxID=2175665 RepID=UPI000DAA06F3|nr:hypothetical protein [Curtobacterium sp. MCBD17_021]PZE66886.1 hypothetical protein DEI83_06140 [Curtobacterium sp. MCBD17_021]